LRLNIVVEGVETAVQKEALVTLGCDKAQGFHFYRPIAAAEMETLLLEQSRA
jgi:EAL domain-containing protein (putative c-di-GMP-specific phosphodiesterase class I)